MASPYRTTISYSRLLDDVWGILQEKREPVFPRGSRAAPSPVVYVFPNFEPNAGYYWQFWEEIAAPTLIELSGNPPQILGGWGNPDSRTTVDAALRAALSGTSWEVKVDFST